MTGAGRRLAAAALVGALVGAGGAADEPLVPVPDPVVPRGLAALDDDGPAPPELPLRLVVFLGLRQRARLDALVLAQQDARTAHFRRWLGPHEIAARFGPTLEEYGRVRRWFRARGFTVVADSPYRVTLTLTGTAAQAEAALGTRVRRFRRLGRRHHAPVLEPVLPASIAASVRGLYGLDDLPKFRPQFRALAPVGDGDSALGPQDFAAAYGAVPLQASGLTGAGTSIAVVARSNFDDGDIALFSTLFGIPLRPVRKLADPRDDPGILGREGEETEVLIDTQWAGALAPGAQVNVVISTPSGDIPEALAKAVTDREGDVITISFGLCEPLAPSILVTELFDAYYAIANAQGQTVLVASGDSGATECAPDDRQTLAVNALASSPHAVAVGGTSFTLAPDGSLPQPLDEVVWNDAAGASGGGTSAVFARPRYQLVPGLPGLERRALPDVALAGSPSTPGYVIVEDGRPRIIGGTSAGAPAFAGLLALVNERLAATHGTSGLGHLLPALYALGSEQVRGLRGPVFRDVTSGTNGFAGAPGFAAAPGYDLATGWGAPLADALAAALEGPGRCEPDLACLVPARGPKRLACAGAWLVEQEAFAIRRSGIPRRRQRCVDGDPQCDVDGVADGRCTMNVALCLNVFDFRRDRLDGRGLPVCEPGIVRRVRLRRPAPDDEPVTADNRRVLRAAIAGLPTLPTRLRSACTATVPVVVPLRSGRTWGRTTLGADVLGSRGRTRARLGLECRTGP
jgi:hypothetical protein